MQEQDDEIIIGRSRREGFIHHHIDYKPPPDNKNNNNNNNNIQLETVRERTSSSTSFSTAAAADRWENKMNMSTTNKSARVLLFDGLSEADDAGIDTVDIEQIANDLERSLPVRDRRYRMQVYKSCWIGKDCIDYLVRSRYVSSRAEAVHLGRRIAKELNLFEHVCRDHELKDDYLFYRFIEPGRRTKARTRTGGQDFFIEEEAIQDTFLLETAEILKHELEIRDRFYRLKRYKKCFIASDAVTYMVKTQLVNSREEAVDLGRRLEIELGLFRHVVNEHTFCDDYLFFEFVGHHAVGGNSSSTIQYDKSNSSVSHDNHRANDRQQQEVQSAISTLSRIRLREIADELRKGLIVKDRRYRLKTYRSCFVAKEAVDFMLEKKFVNSREEAVQLGRSLEEELRLFFHVCNDHNFTDGYLFFRFTPRVDSAMNDSFSGSRNVSNSCSDSWNDKEGTNLHIIARKLQLGVKVKDRKYRLKTYSSCAVGCEMVDFIVQARFAASREDAVEIGQRLMDEMQLFEHVTADHPFRDGKNGRICCY